MLSLKRRKKQIIITFHNELFLHYLLLAIVTPLNYIVVFLFLKHVVAVFVPLIEYVLGVPLREMIVV